MRTEQQEAELIQSIKALLPKGAAFILLAQYDGANGKEVTEFASDGLDPEAIPSILIHSAVLLKAAQDKQK